MNEVILINGASRGIGRHVWEYLSEHLIGCKFSLVSRTPIHMWKEEIKHFQCNSRDYKQVKQVVQKTLNLFGRIDVLINVAGILNMCSLEDETEEGLDNTFLTNLKSYWYFVKEVFPLMKKLKKGYIINLSSMQAKRVFKNKSSYAISKGAVNSLTQSINREGNQYGIRATAICPGFVDTDMVNDVKQPGENIIPISDIVYTIDYLLNLSKNAIIQEICIERKLW